MDETNRYRLGTLGLGAAIVILAAFLAVVIAGWGPFADPQPAKQPTDRPSTTSPATASVR